MRMWLLGTVMMLPVSAFAAGCEGYPTPTGGIDPEARAQGKWIATESVAVPFNDTRSINDARKEAVMGAKAIIAAAMENPIERKEVIKRAIQEGSLMSNAGTEDQRRETVERVSSLAESAQAVLRGVMVVGDCYSKEDKEVRVTVGVKPETIAQAGELADLMRTSINGSSTPTIGNVGSKNPSTTDTPSQPQGGVPRGPLRERDGYSNIEGIRKF